MPNWCDNMVTLRHEDKSKIDALEAELSKRDPEGYSFTGEFFNSVRPNPAGEWQYDWSVNNWGTKWEASIIDFERNNNNEIFVCFESAWSPPIAFYEFLVEEGWEVDATYLESGMGFAGKFTNDGSDEYYEYDITDPESIEELPDEIIDFGDLRTRAEEYQEEQLEEKLSELERTDWYEVSINPVREGRYEVTSTSWDFPQYCNWDGEKWGRWDGDNIDVNKWRGLIEEYNEEEMD